MREIKFRAWNKKYKKMFFFGLFDIHAGGAVVGNGDNCNDITGGDGENIIMVYTGLKDKNKKEIYEGDILTYLDGSGARKVYWGRFGWEIDGQNEYEVSDLTYIDNCEIIGNIYENPELVDEDNNF